MMLGICSAGGEEGETHAERLQRLDAEVAALRSAAASDKVAGSKVRISASLRRSLLCLSWRVYQVAVPRTSRSDSAWVGLFARISMLQCHHLVAVLDVTKGECKSRWAKVETKS